jgi:hypothetical protein
MRSKLQNLSTRDTGTRLIAANNGLRELKKAVGPTMANALVSAGAAVAIQPLLPRRGRLAGSGFAVRVVGDFVPGPGGGFNANRLDAVLGRPQGAGLYEGSYDVVSLGRGGNIVLEMGRDFSKYVIIFENAVLGDDADKARIDLGVGPPGLASADQIQWYGLSTEVVGEPVITNSRNQIPVDSAEAGGTRRVLAEDPGLPPGMVYRYIRITDTGTGPIVAPTTGFDPDALYVV